jgi:hypothetical protein
LYFISYALYIYIHNGWAFIGKTSFEVGNHSCENKGMYYHLAE